MGFQGSQGLLDLTDRRACLDYWDQKVNLARRARRDWTAEMASLESPASTVCRVETAWTEYQGETDTMAHPVFREGPGPTALMESLECRDPEVHQACLVLQGFQEHEARKEHLATLVPQVFLALLPGNSALTTCRMPLSY